MAWPDTRLGFYKEVHEKGICVMGEYGEYHTFVVDGPVFKKKVQLEESGVVLNSGLWSLYIQRCVLSDKKE
jgi:diphthine-ammonia ligase